MLNINQLSKTQKPILNKNAKMNTYKTFTIFNQIVNIEQQYKTITKIIITDHIDVSLSISLYICVYEYL